jgi:hypothetical protein
MPATQKSELRSTKPETNPKFEYFNGQNNSVNPNVAKVGGLQSQACYIAVSLELKLKRLYSFWFQLQ